MNCLKKYGMIALAVAGIGLFGGCTAYVEQPTAAGHVAPAITPQPVQPYRPAQHTAPMVVAGSEAPSGTGGQPLMDSSIINRFERVYRHKGMPRLAIFMNRSLSDEVREWATDSRAVLSTSGNMTTQSGDTVTTYSGPAGISGYQQKHLPSGSRSNPGESWMWRFEEGFLGPFLEIGARVVDRTAIMRLAAADSGLQGDPYTLMSVKKVEMDALKGKADLFVEILIRRAPGQQLGYEFKTSAKEVATGIIRAHVTSIGWNYLGEPTESITATGSGYQFVKDDPAGQLPDVDIVARDLALSLMQSLAGNWER